jgi:hypothetical protein
MPDLVMSLIVWRPWAAMEGSVANNSRLIAGYEVTSNGSFSDTS